MEIKDEYIIILGLCLLAITAWSLNSIHNFMPIVSKCQPSFDIINKCGCVPDENLAKLFNVKNYHQININNLTIK